MHIFTVPESYLSEPEITRQDRWRRECGTHAPRAGAEGVLKVIQQRGITRLNASRYMSEIAEIVEEVMGGTSGSLYSIFFAGLASAFGSSDSTTLTSEIWGTCLQAALTNLYRYTRARPSSRTLADPL